MRKGIVIIETRTNVGLIDTIINHRKFMPSDWEMCLFCTQDVINELNDYKQKYYFPEIGNISKLNDRELSSDAYNRMLTSSVFWNMLPYDKVLITQTDARMLREGIDEFMEFGYVGAPWVFQPHGGNGGFSLRDVKVMKAICDRFPYDPSKHGNEDVYFSNHMFNFGIGRLAPRDVCKKFATESIIEFGTLGAHAIEKYAPKETVDKIYHQYDK